HAEQADHIVTSLLEEVARRRTWAVIVDMTGLEGGDEATARHVIRLSRMLGLLGTRMVLTGIRPAVAQAIVDRSGALGALEAYGTLKEALGRVQRRQRRPA